MSTDTTSAPILSVANLQFARLLAIRSGSPDSMARVDMGSLLSLISGAAVGLERYATTAARDAVVKPDGTLCYVFKNAGSETDPANGFYQADAGGWVAAPWVSLAFGAEAQPAIDAAEAAIAQVSGIVSEVPSIGLVAWAGAVNFESGHFAGFMDTEGRVYTHASDGAAEPVLSRSTIGGDLTPSPCLLGSSPVRWFEESDDGRVREALTESGGHFVETPTGLGRANADWFSRKFDLGAWTATDTSGPGEPGYDFAGEAHRAAQGDLDDWIILIGYPGASTMNGETGNGEDTGEALVADTPMFPANIFTPSTGPRVFIDDVHGDTTSDAFIPLVERVEGTLKETICSGWANALATRHEADFGKAPNVIAFTAAVGNRSSQMLGRGTPAHDAMTKQLGLAVAAIRSARPHARITPVFCWWLPGEVDHYGWSDIDRAKSNMLAIKRQIDADARLICNSLDRPTLLVVQTGWVGDGSKPFDQPARQACVELDGVEGIKLVGPDYFAERSGPIHLSNVGYNQLGQLIGHATYEHLFGMGWRTPKPIAAYRVENNGAYPRWRFEFGSMGGATVQDLAGPVAPAGLSAQGINVSDSTGATPAVRDIIFAGRTITVELTAMPAGKRITFAFATKREPGPDAPDYQDGPVEGARSVFRDSRTYDDIYDPGTPIGCWVPGFIHHIAGD